jgi:hypothetical protein
MQMVNLLLDRIKGIDNPMASNSHTHELPVRAGNCKLPARQVRTGSQIVIHLLKFS